MDDGTQVWERQPGDTNKSWKAFKVYLDMGEGRSLAKVASELGKQPNYKKILELWSVKYNWVERCRQYDAHIDRLNRSLHESEKRSEYARKIEAYREETEQVGRALLNMGILQMQILHRELNTRLRNPERLTPHEMANLMRSSAQAIDTGTRLIAEALSIDQVTALLNDTVSQRN